MRDGQRLPDFGGGGIIPPNRIRPTRGLTVQVLPDGAVQPPKVVTTGKITQDRPSDKAVIDLEFVSLPQPTETEVQMNDGTAQGRQFHCPRVVVRFCRTSGCEASLDPDLSPWKAISFRNTSMPMDFRGNDLATRQPVHFPCF